MKAQEPYILRIKIKPRVGIALLCGVWTIGALGIIVTMLIGLIQEIHRAEDYLLIITFFSLGGLFTLRVLLWQLRGYEVIEINHTEVKIYKEGIFLTLTKRFERTYVNGFYVTQKPTTPFFSRIYGLSGGEITMEYLDKKIYVGQTLTTGEATEYSKLLNEKL